MRGLLPLYQKSWTSKKARASSYWMERGLSPGGQQAGSVRPSERAAEGLGTGHQDPSRWSGVDQVAQIQSWPLYWSSADYGEELKTLAARPRAQIPERHIPFPSFWDFCIGLHHRNRKCISHVSSSVNIYKLVPTHDQDQESKCHQLPTSTTFAPFLSPLLKDTTLLASKGLWYILPDFILFIPIILIALLS